MAFLDVNLPVVGGIHSVVHALITQHNCDQSFVKATMVAKASFELPSRSKLPYWSEYWSLSINADKFLSIPINVDHCWSMSDQGFGIHRHWSTFFMRISKKSTSGSTWMQFVVKAKCFGNAGLPSFVMYWQFLLMFYWCLDWALIGIDQNWLALIDIDWHWTAIIGIEQY